MKAACVLLAAWLAAANAQAQLPYDSDSERFGASMSAPVARRELVRKTLEYCGGAFADLRLDSQVAYARWVRRHAGFLQLAGSIRRAFAETAAKDPAKAAQWKQMVEEYLPKQVEKLSGTAAQMIAELPSESARRQMCSGSIAAINAQKMDLDSGDPEIAKFMRGIAAKNKIELPPPGADIGAADARREAAAMIGKWKTEKLTQYFADGSRREAGGACTFLVSRDSVLSDCRAGERALRVRYEYRADDAGHYQYKVLEHSANPAAVGGRTAGVFRVEGARLFVSVFPPTFESDTARPVEVETAATLDAEVTKP